MSNTVNAAPHNPIGEIIRALKSRLATPWTITLLVPVLVAIMDPAQLGTIVEFAIRALLSTLPYIIFAVLLIAYLKASGAQSMIAQAFQGRENHMIVMAALFGGLAPFCSCEVIPFIAGLLALGAPLSAVMAFWLSSPLIDPPTLLITAAALGWPFAIGKAVAAVALGLMGGVAIKYITRAGFLNEVTRAAQTKGCGCGPDPFDDKPVWRFWNDDTRIVSFKAEALANGLFLLRWLALAYALEALLVHYMPAGLIARLVGGEGVGPIAVAALVGMPAYLNSYVAPALLSGLMEQGMSAGAAMSFMVAGAVSSVPAMAAVWSLVHARVFVLYIGLGILGAIMSGIIFQIVV